MKNRVIAFILTIIIVLSLVSVTIFAASKNSVDFGEVKIDINATEEYKEDDIKDIFNYVPTKSGGGGGSATYYYRDSYFLSASNKYNAHLATLSMAVSMAASADSGRFYDDEFRNAEALFSDTGFEAIESNVATDAATTPDTIGVVVAKKTIYDNDKPYTLVSVAYRSGGYGSEWASNFMVGSEQTCPGGHLGFHKARDRALEFILDYLDRNVNGDTKLWISGFSRGGALSGLTGAWFNDNRESLSKQGILLEKDDIFTYTFEAPASIDSELNKQRNYDNIFNIINPNDIIPLLPFSGWGLERPGKTHYLTNYTKSNADVINKMLSSLNSKLVYDSYNFLTYTNSVGSSQAEFINNMCNILASRLDRDTYANKVENTMSHMLDKLLNSNDEEMALLISAFADNILDDLGIDIENEGSEGAWKIVSLVFALLDGEDDAVGLVCDAIGKNLVRSNFIEVYDRETKEALHLLLSAILSSQGDDNLVAYALVMTMNPNILSGHTPEIILAALMCEDNYYPSNYGVWSSGHSKRENFVTVAVNDGQRVYSLSYMKGTTVTVSASSTRCVDFLGWYIDGRFVTSDSDLTFVADADTSVRAASAVVHKSLGSWSVDDAAFAFFEGSMSRGCSTCGAKYVETLPAPMTFDNPLTIAILCGSVGFLMILTSVIIILVKKKKKGSKDQSSEHSEEQTAD